MTQSGTVFGSSTAETIGLLSPSSLVFRSRISKALKLVGRENVRGHADELRSFEDRVPASATTPEAN
jgi:hypothetical protein